MPGHAKRTKANNIADMAAALLRLEGDHIEVVPETWEGKEGVVRDLIWGCCWIGARRCLRSGARDGRANRVGLGLAGNVVLKSRMPGAQLAGEA
ncbi:hypothetical protein HD554DRAFT_2115513 [Boletus coccyginus]|nr:hypothetical protein HD554DRAFT_2115513 [Boletus coccyginus]